MFYKTFLLFLYLIAFLFTASLIVWPIKFFCRYWILGFVSEANYFLINAALVDLSAAGDMILLLSSN